MDTLSERGMAILLDLLINTVAGIVAGFILYVLLSDRDRPSGPRDTKKLYPRGGQSIFSLRNLIGVTVLLVMSALIMWTSLRLPNGVPICMGTHFLVFVLPLFVVWLLMRR